MSLQIINTFAKRGNIVPVDSQVQYVYNLTCRTAIFKGFVGRFISGLRNLFIILTTLIYRVNVLLKRIQCCQVPERVHCHSSQKPRPFWHLPHLLLLHSFLGLPMCVFMLTFFPYTMNSQKFSVLKTAFLTKMTVTTVPWQL
jgi:hypothetical protein